MADSKRDSELIEASGLFDRSWYLSVYPDVSASGLDPLDHYLRYGASLRRNPGPMFDANRYLALNRDVADSGVNPLLHYLLHGRREGRNAVPCATAAGDPVGRAETAASAVDLPEPERDVDFDALSAENQRLRTRVAEQQAEIEMNLLQLRGLQEELENWFRQYLALKESSGSSDALGERDAHDGNVSRGDRRTDKPI
jgi:hypothetical protein